MEKITKKDILRNEMKREVRRLRRMSIKTIDGDEWDKLQEEIKAVVDLIGKAK